MRTLNPQVMRPAPTVHYRFDETRERVCGVTLIRCGGHFSDSSVLHWADGAAETGVLFTGDPNIVVYRPSLEPLAFQTTSARVW